MNGRSLDQCLIAISLLLVAAPGHVAQGELSEHRRLVRGGDPSEVRSVTIIEGTEREVDTSRTQPHGRVPRCDEGEGELLWSAFDEDAVSENVALSADGQWVAVGYDLNLERFELRSASDGEVVITYPAGDGPGWVSIMADGSLAAFAALDSVWLFSREGGETPVFRLGLGGYLPGPVALSRDGSYLVVTANDPEWRTNRAWCYEVGGPEPLWTMEADADESYAWYGVTIARDCSVVALTGKLHLYLVELGTGEPVWDEPTYNTESPVALSADGGVLAIASLSGWLRLFVRSEDDDGYRELWRYRFSGGTSNWVSACQLSADGLTLAAGTLDFYEDHYAGRLALFDALGVGEPLWTSEPLGDEVSAVALSDDGSIIAATSWGDLAHQTPDLVVHERHSREPFYTLSTPGSLSGLGMSDDGRRIVAGGKGVHNRVWGRGGRLCMVEVSAPGGVVAGMVRDEDGEPLAGVNIAADGNPYTAISDEIGAYRLLVEVEVERELTVVAAAPGYMDGIRQGVRAVRGEVTGGIDFALAPAGPPPRGLRASRVFRNHIALGWEPYNDELLAHPNIGGLPLLSAAGDRRAFAGMTPFEEGSPSKRDGCDQAEAINIYRSSLSGGPFAFIGSVEGGDTSFVDRDGIQPGRDYYYVISADFGGGESAYSDEAAGQLDSDWLVWEADLEPMPAAPQIDGVIDEDEWRGAELRDISDAYGYDGADSAGSVTARVGFSGDSDRLYLGFDYFVQAEIEERMGVGVYVDDDGNGDWSRQRPGSEGNYWGYWIEGQPDMRYRSLAGPPYNASPYYQFPNPELAFSDGGGYVQIEMAIPLGFHGLEEVALFAPDRTIGLGLFAMHRDRDGNPVFNGWWPQDMFSIVTGPEQYARIRVPADLCVPPVEPADVTVLRDDGAIRVTWSDPEMGLDSARVEALAGINIYRNGDPYAEVEVGNEFFRDSAVVNGGWYEYSLAGFIIEGDVPFEGPRSVPAGVYAVSDPVVTELSYDDGTPEAYYVVTYDGEDNRFAVCYDLWDFGDTAAVYWVDIFGGGADPIGICIARDDDGIPGEQVGGSFVADVRRQGEFHRFHFPDVRQPVVIIPPDGFPLCWAVLRYLPETPASPPIGVDSNNPEAARNKYHTAEGGWQDFAAGQLMVRIGVGVPLDTSSPQENPPLPERFWIGQNYPNPFNRCCVIPVDLPAATALGLDVFDLEGRLILSRKHSVLRAGRAHIALDSERLGAGIYIVRIRSGSGEGAVKVSLVK